MILEVVCCTGQRRRKRYGPMLPLYCLMHLQRQSFCTRAMTTTWESYRMKKRKWTFFRMSINLAEIRIIVKLDHLHQTIIFQRTFTLDKVVKERGFPLPDFIKIDVQGCEMDTTGRYRNGKACNPSDCGVAAYGIQSRGDAGVGIGADH